MDFESMNRHLQVAIGLTEDRAIKKFLQEKVKK